MPTTYDAIPSILERVIGSHLIVLGTARGPVRVEPVDGSEPPTVHGWFEVGVQDTLYGDPPADTVLVRMTGSGSADDTDWRVPVARDEALLWILTRDIGPDLPDNLFAPCHDGVYEISADGDARIPDEALDSTTRELAGSDTAPLTLDGLRRLIGAVERRRGGHLRRTTEEEPAAIQDEPRPDTHEYPRSALATVEASLAAPGGGQPDDIE